jgi:hypothetical protein
LTQSEQIVNLQSELCKAQSKVPEGRNSWDGRGSWGSGGGSITTNAEVDEHLKHVREIMTQFLVKLPQTTKENEDLLPIVFSMLNFKKEEQDQIKATRDALNAQIAEANKPQKKSFFGINNKKK